MNLVTGATGILGSHVVLQLLRDGQSAVACYRREEDKGKLLKLFSYYEPESEGLYSLVQWRKVDISDIYSVEDALEGITSVYHCAGFVSFHAADRKKLIRINEEGTRNVVNACLSKKIGALCHVSSLATLHNLDHRTSPLDENTFWKRSGKESDYSISKYNAEREVWRGMEEGLRSVIVNPGVIIGPGFWTQSSSRIFETAFKGNPFYTDGRTAYVSATDVARAMLSLVRERKFGNRYVLVENNYSFKQIFTWINTGLGKPAPRIKVSRSVLHMGRIFEKLAQMLTGREAVLSNAVINAAFNTQKYSSEKLKKELGFEFEPVEKTIRNCCRIYLKERSKGGSSV